jgi:hypothetical protein
MYRDLLTEESKKGEKRLKEKGRNRKVGNT